MGLPARNQLRGSSAAWSEDSLSAETKVRNHYDTIIIEFHDLARAIAAIEGPDSPHAIAARADAEHLTQRRKRHLRDIQKRHAANDN